MKKSKYTTADKEYALSLLPQFDGIFDKVAQYLKDEGRINVTGRTLQNWANELPMVVNVPTAVLIAKPEPMGELTVAEIKKHATKGLSSVVIRLNEKLDSDRYTHRLTSYELVNIGNFFASLTQVSELGASSGTANVYQQIINQTYNAKGN